MEIDKEWSFDLGIVLAFFNGWQKNPLNDASGAEEGVGMPCELYPVLLPAPPESSLVYPKDISGFL